jgi:hypothetical protein
MILSANFDCFRGVAGIAHNDGLGLCVRWGFPAQKPIDSTNVNFSTNDYR